MSDFQKKTNRCPVCGRIIPAHTGECAYCLRDIENPPKKVAFTRTEEPAKKKWIPWVIGGVLLVLIVWVIRTFLHFVDYLLKGR